MNLVEASKTLGTPVAYFGTPKTRRLTYSAVESPLQDFGSTPFNMYFLWLYSPCFLVVEFQKYAKNYGLFDIKLR